MHGKVCEERKKGHRRLMFRAPSRVIASVEASGSSSLSLSSSSSFSKVKIRYRLGFNFVKSAFFFNGRNRGNECFFLACFLLD